MIFFMAFVLFCMSVFGIDSSVADALAMEQQVRCGKTEHIHSAECYLDKVLVCGKTAHSHNEQCYLLNLEDNDINSLIDKVASSEDKSLETLLADESIPKVTKTSTASVSESTDTQSRTEEQTVTASADNSMASPLVLNESLLVADTSSVTGVSLMSEDTPVVLNDITGDSGIALAAVTPSTGTRALNIMAYVDGSWQCITVANFVTSGSYRYISRANLIDALNDAIEPSYGSSAAFRVRYATSQNGSYSNSTSYNDGYRMGRSSSSSAIYIRLYRSGTSGTDPSNAISYTTVNYVYETDPSLNRSVMMPTSSVVALDDEYNWTRSDNGGANNKEVSGNQTVNNGPVTFTASTKEATVTFIENGKVVKEETREGGFTSYTLPGFNGDFDKWIDEDGNEYYPGDTVYNIMKDMTFTAGKFYTVTYIVNDTENSVQVLSGKTITLPSLDTGYSWSGNDGLSYSPGERVTIREDIVFTAFRSLNIVYNVNFSRGTLTLTEATPTVNGSTTQPVAQGSSAVIRDVTDRNVTGSFAGMSSRYGTVHFEGWQVGDTDTIIYPNTRLSWEEIVDYSLGGQVTLTGVWSYNMINNVNFFIKYNGEAFNADGTVITGAPGQYTGVVFTTYAGGFDTSLTKAVINKTIAIPVDNEISSSVELNERVRALYGNAGGIWLAEFPRDEDMFEMLRPYADAGQLTYTDIDGNIATVKSEDLSSDEYEIRWYAFRIASEVPDTTAYDNWHVDGALVRKVGIVDISKQFSGNEESVKKAKDGFLMVATNGTITHTLDLNNAKSYDPDTETYQWQIRDVGHKEEWTITEYPSKPNDLLLYSEWKISDPEGINTQTAGSGSSFKIKGVNRALDLSKLAAGFNNIYYPAGSLMIKKEDAITNEPLTGAEFALYQAGERMTFDYDTSTGTYVYNMDGTGEFDTLAGHGYLNISSVGFSYDKGDIIIREVKSPEGYIQVGEIVIGYVDEGGDTVGIKNGAEAFCEYHDGLLVVENGSHSINVTAKKEWNGNERANVYVDLLANGSTNFASELLPTGQNTTAILTSTNGYTFSWTGLPVYANGRLVEWTIRETRIGDELCRPDYTFANWINSYEPPVYDSGGNITLVVENTPKRPLIYINKTDMSGKIPLGGAQFRLVEVDENGNEKGIAKTGETTDGGTLVFDNLRYEVRYKLTEVKPPGGHIGFSEPAYFVIYDGGNVVVEEHANVTMSSTAYNIQVTNRSAEPLPATGGNVWIIRSIGLSLMMISMLIYIELSRRKGAGPV